MSLAHGSCVQSWNDRLACNGCCSVYKRACPGLDCVRRSDLDAKQYAAQTLMTGHCAWKKFAKHLHGTSYGTPVDIYENSQISLHTCFPFTSLLTSILKAPCQVFRETFTDNKPITEALRAAIPAANRALLVLINPPVCREYYDLASGYN